MATLVCSPEMFGMLISDIIKSGVTFELEQTPHNEIKITFTGGY